jgi:hypothetical protein
MRAKVLEQGFSFIRCPSIARCCPWSTPIDAAAAMGDGRKESKVRDLLDVIGRIIWGLKREKERSGSRVPLPHYRTPAYFSTNATPHKGAGEMDDEVPV